MNFQLGPQKTTGHFATLSLKKGKPKDRPQPAASVNALFAESMAEDERSSGSGLPGQGLPLVSTQATVAGGNRLIIVSGSLTPPSLNACSHKTERWG
ncbi:hypothetical protein FOZ63_016587 [Perkinsus olseni]|uniref:Uncharacterized protein n=1 Tax=Perkinsus olseni TaxID=32597 RepID=A0A7J6PVG5_PEROL|nr:hypothetical protein FOZ63_016587 [Perkinsus olseni]